MKRVRIGGYKSLQDVDVSLPLVDRFKPADGPYVMPGLVPGISLDHLRRAAAWMPGTSPGMTM